jgi:hypothetical protein
LGGVGELILDSRRTFSAAPGLRRLREKDDSGQGA